MPSPEKFRETLDGFCVSQDIMDVIYAGYDGIVSKSNKKMKSAFFKQALDVMHEKLPPEKVQEIIEANACCKSGLSACVRRSAGLNAITQFRGNTAIAAEDISNTTMKSCSV